MIPPVNKICQHASAGAQASARLQEGLSDSNGLLSLRPLDEVSDRILSGGGLVAHAGIIPSSIRRINSCQLRRERRCAKPIPSQRSSSLLPPSQPYGAIRASDYEPLGLAFAAAVLHHLGAKLQDARTGRHMAKVGPIASVPL